MDTGSFIVHVKTDDIYEDTTVQTMKQTGRCLEEKIKM